MKIAQINMVAEGSTGNIMRNIAICARGQGHEVITFSSPSFSRSHPETYSKYENHRYFGTPFSHALHFVLGKITGRNGCFSYLATKRLVRQLKDFSPDILHLHNLHNWCIHIPTLFRYIKKNKIRVYWTLHDCWTFTGQCPYFDMVGCEKWKSGCYDCPQNHVYPESLCDATRWGYRFKKKWFSDIENLTLITPSQWLANLVKESFMQKHTVKVINNGIDLSLYMPMKSDFREKFNISEDCYVILGVAFEWGERKGLDVFIELDKRLDERFQIVLVGTNENIDRKLPKSIISIHNTQNRQELVQIYTAANLFVNPTREDNFPTVNLEALACGTPVVTFRTGGSPEALDSSCGMTVEKNDIDALVQAIFYVYEKRPYTADACIRRAKRFEANKRFEEYTDLYASD